MPTTYTSLLGMALPVTGELSGTWGDTVNNYITQYVDASVAGTQTISGSQTAVTLSVTNGTSLSQAGSSSTGSSQYMMINCTGSPASLLTITAPASSKAYVILNATSTSQSVKIVGAGPTTGVTIASGEKAVVAWNGSDFVKVASSAVDGVSTFSAGTTGFTPSTATSGAVTLAGTLATTNGGTGLTTFTAANNAIYSTSSSALTAGTLPVAAGGSGAATLTGVLKGNGTSAFTAATAGTDYVAPGTATTFTATQTFQGTSSTLGAIFNDAAEVTTVSATAATGTINYDVTTQSVLYYTTNASGNFVINLRGSSGTTMNSLMSTGQSLTVVFLNTNGSTAYRNTSVQVDGTTSGVTTRWQGGSAPSAGNPNSVDAYTYTVIKTGSATYSVFAAQTAFA